MTFEWDITDDAENIIILLSERFLGLQFWECLQRQRRSYWIKQTK